MRTMTTFVHNLVPIEVSPNMQISVSVPASTDQVTLDDPAIRVMTDLSVTRAITTGPEQSIEFALELMRHAGVRMLVVTGQDETLAGLVTARDITGEKPIIIMSRDKVSRNDIRVHQVMTPLEELNPFEYTNVVHASVRQVIIHLRDVGRQHAIVIQEKGNTGNYFLRGIFSITQIGRLLGMEISTDGHVQSFAEFEQLIA